MSSRAITFGSRSGPPNLCQYRHVAMDEEPHVACRFPFQRGVQDDVGYPLYAAQLGERSVKAKPLHGLGGEVMEIAAHDASGTYRTIYTVSIRESIYVIHAFQKTSKTGIGKP